jgi:hypothetical protein
MQDFGRSARRQRREEARQLAKELLVSQGYKPGYRTELVIAAISLFLPLGWGELVSGRETWRIVLGWVLWLIPFLLLLHVFWRWSRDKKWYGVLRFGLPTIGVIAFLCSSAYSIWDSMLPNFVFVKPGVVLNPDDPTKTFWMFFVVIRSREPFYNVQLSFEDLIKGERINKAFREGRMSQSEFSRLAWSNLYEHQYPELDPIPGAMDAELWKLNWQPDVLDDEHYSIRFIHRTGVVSEDLRLKNTSDGWQVAMKVVDEKSRNLIHCKDSKFPVSQEWPEGLQPCFSHYPDRYRDLSRYKFLVLKVLGLEKMFNSGK